MPRRADSLMFGQRPLKVGHIVLSHTTGNLLYVHAIGPDTVDIYDLVTEELLSVPHTGFRQPYYSVAGGLFRDGEHEFRRRVRAALREGPP
ncbi:MAG TPA: hypothetical protein VMT30_00445 [Candidatus Saccharimonadia bacterium]|nr:hypothetical protein [Candidatus Saccharimonadia bacterium]